MLLASEASPAFGLLDSRWIVGNRSEPGTSRNAACSYAARRISFKLKDSTKQFGWLRASAINCSFLSTGSQYPATVRICRDSPPSNRSLSGRRISLKNLTDPGVGRLLNHVQQPVAFDGHIKVWAGGLSLANAFSHPHVQLGNVERKPRRDRGWNPAIALRDREIRQRFAACAPRTMNSETWI
jgi:hypothetical protein